MVTMELDPKPEVQAGNEGKYKNMGGCGGNENGQDEISKGKASETGEAKLSPRSSTDGSEDGSVESESDFEGTSIFQLLRESKQAPALRRLQRTPPELPPDAVDPGSGWALLHFTGYYGCVCIPGGSVTEHLVY
jgi:hypothetical protein